MWYTDLAMFRKCFIFIQNLIVHQVTAYGFDNISVLLFGEGNGNPLQCSCLENPWDGGAWWAAICGVAHSRTRLKRLRAAAAAVLLLLRSLCHLNLNYKVIRLLN